MYLESTPYINIRKANGLYNIDYTACDIIGLENDSSTAAARSYNTIIGVYTKDSTGNKIYLQTAGSYSTTTATKHKPRAAAIADYNNYKIIPDIKPEILRDLYFYNKHNISEILQESQERQELLKELQDNNSTGNTIKHLKYKGVIKARKEPKTTPYKNGNLLAKYYYKTNFKYVSNIYYEVNIKHIPQKLPAFYGRTGYKPETTINTIKTNIVNISY